MVDSKSTIHLIHTSYMEDLYLLWTEYSCRLAESNVEALISNMVVFEGGAFGK